MGTKRVMHPLFAYTAAFIFGILAKHFQFNFILIASTIIPALCLSAIFYFYNIKNQNSWRLYLIILFFGLGFFRFHIWGRNYNQTAEMLHLNTNYTAKVLDISDHNNPFFKHKITLKLKSPTLYAQIDNCILNVYVPKPYDVKMSDNIEIRGLKIARSQNRQGLLFSSENVIPKCFTSKLSFSVIHRPYFSLFRMLKETKYNLAKKLRSKMSKATNVLFEYIFLGLKNPSDLSDSLRYKFNYWGIAHYLARSGLHVVMIIFLWSLFLKLMPINFILKQLLLTILCLIYSFLSWPSTSFERAFSGFLLVQICLALKLPFRSSHLIILCVLSFLIFNPIYLFCLDFQLSFGLALGISFFNELQNKKR